VGELEQDLATAGADLKMANKQSSEVANKLQEATDEVSQLPNANSQLAQESMVSGLRTLPAVGFLPFVGLCWC
jgi:hypothetical protein